MTRHMADQDWDALMRAALAGDASAYARFLRACEATGYDIELLQRRFGAGFEHVAHRLTTLQRVGARPAYREAMRKGDPGLEPMLG